MDIADFDEIRAAQKYGPGFACLLRAISYGDELERIAIGRGKATAGGPWLVAFQTPKGSCTLPAEIARAWADQITIPSELAQPQDTVFVSAMRAIADECDRLNAPPSSPANDKGE